MGTEVSEEDVGNIMALCDQVNPLALVLHFVSHSIEWYYILGLLFNLSLPTPASPQVIQLAEYRAQLYDYLKSRMMAIAPNLTVLVRPARGGEFRCTLPLCQWVSGELTCCCSCRTLLPGSSRRWASWWAPA